MSRFPSSSLSLTDMSSVFVEIPNKGTFDFQSCLSTGDSDHEHDESDVDDEELEDEDALP